MAPVVLARTGEPVADAIYLLPCRLEGVLQRLSSGDVEATAALEGGEQLMRVDARGVSAVVGNLEPLARGRLRDRDKKHRLAVDDLGARAAVARHLLRTVLLVVLDVGVGFDPASVMNDGHKIMLYRYFLGLRVVSVNKLAGRRKGAGGRERLGVASRGQLVAVDRVVLDLAKLVVDLANLVAQRAEALVVLAPRKASAAVSRQRRRGTALGTFFGACSIK